MGRKKISPKMVAAVLGMAEGKHPKQAMRDAGYSASGSSARLSRLQNHQELAAVVEEALIRHGATLDKIGRVASEAMDATTVETFLTRDASVRRKKPEGLDAELEGEIVPANTIVYSEPLIDHQTRLKAAELTAKLIGADQRSRDRMAPDASGKGAVNILVIAQQAKSMSDEELTDAIQRIQCGTFDPAQLPKSARSASPAQASGVEGRTVNGTGDNP